MPAYNRWGAPIQSRLPLTPPDYSSSYMNPMSAVTDEMHNFYPPAYYASRQSQSAREYNDQYHHTAPYSTQSSLPPQMHSRSKQFHGSRDYNAGYSHRALPQQFGAVPYVMLPPMNVNDEMTKFPAHYPHAHPEPQPKEEKPTGGVAQHLDYEMELMSSFVAEMSQRMYAMLKSGLHLTDVNMMRSVTHSSSPSPQFRKYVSQILSSTRLPSSTIMLGLFYLQERMKIVSRRGQDTSSSGTVYRMLTTCLLLGSKFLDDNTFQNRSWAEVSSIPVTELNTMELEWLKDFNWEIHGLMYDKDEGFFMWIDHWHAYKEKVQLAKVKESQKLAPIETSFVRNHPTPRPLMSPEGPIPAQYQHGPQYDTQWVRPYMSEYSPPSAPDSGPATPEYYANNWAYPQAPQSYARASWNLHSAGYNGQRASVHGFYAPFQHQAYGHHAWAGHGVNCGCTLCAENSDYYFNHGYGLQTVAG